MMHLSAGDADRFLRAVQAARHPEYIARVKLIYDDVMNAVASRAPRCDISGRCCRFEEYRHRLFVTTLEFAAFIAEIQPWRDAWDGLGCPYQVNGLCSVHVARPFGCRIYFCDPTAQAWQQDQYEIFHQRLKRLHEELGIEYFYVEWRDGLAVLGQAMPDKRNAAVSEAGSAAVKLTVLPTPESK